MTKNHGVVALLKKGGKFLLLKDSRELMLGFWAPPHGRCDDNDKTEEDSVIREVKEETSLTVLPTKKLWTTKADTKVETVSFWLVEIEDGSIKIDERESSEYGWFTPEEALSLDLYPGTEKFFILLKKGGITI